MDETAVGNRRDFGKRVALLAAVSVAAGAGRVAAQPAPAGRAETVTMTAGSLAELVRLRHGRHLSAEQLRLVRRALEFELRAADRLRRFPLSNADDPAFAFRAELP